MLLIRTFQEGFGGGLVTAEKQAAYVVDSVARWVGNCIQGHDYKVVAIAEGLGRNDLTDMFPEFEPAHDCLNDLLPLLMNYSAGVIAFDPETRSWMIEHARAAE